MTRLADDHYFLTTSTSHEHHVHELHEYLLDVWWPDLDVNLTRVTEQWAAIVVAGPDALALLQKIETSPFAGEMQHLSMVTGSIMGIGARILRLSFSGEWAVEIYVPASHGARLWRQLRDLGAVPYGLDAMDALRIEKGYIGVGAEANGRSSPIDLGLPSGRNRSDYFIGKQGLQRLHAGNDHRLELVGLLADEPKFRLNEGAQLIDHAEDQGFGSSVGHITSAGYSPTLQRYVALALLRNGRSRKDGTLYVADPINGAATPALAHISSPVFYDPENARLRE